MKRYGFLLVGLLILGISVYLYRDDFYKTQELTREWKMDKENCQFQYNSSNLENIPFFYLQKYDNMVGSIYIEDTKIDYPIMQAADNEYYLNHDILGNENSEGSLFMDCRNYWSDPLIVIHGHNMKNKTMFGTLKNYLSKSYLAEHKYISVEAYQNGKLNNSRYEIIKCTVLKENDLLYQSLEMNLDEFKEENSTFLILSTCHGKSERLIVISRKDFE